MFDLSATELVGYAASALVVLSLTMTSVVRLRMISLAGSLTFVGYGVLIESVPILITNASIAVINIWFLRAELGNRRDLGVVVVPASSPFLADFVHSHRRDIERFQPAFEMPSGDTFCLVLMRDGLPAGAVIGQRHGDELRLVLDYVLRAYRDSRLGRWLYGTGSAVFRDEGIERLVTRPGNDAHRTYLERVGFRPADGDYVLSLR